MATEDTQAYSLTYYADIPPIGAVDSAPFSMTYSQYYVPGNGADSPPYSMTYGGNYTPIKTVGTDSIGQQCAVMKALGNEAGGQMHFVVRTSGPYGVSDCDLIRSGSEEVVFWASVANMARQQVLVTDLAPATTYYWGATFDTGSASTAGQFTTQQLPADEQGLTPEGMQP